MNATVGPGIPEIGEGLRPEEASKPPAAESAWAPPTILEQLLSNQSVRGEGGDSLKRDGSPPFFRLSDT